MLVLVASEKLGLNLNWFTLSHPGSALCWRLQSACADSALASLGPATSQNSRDLAGSLCGLRSGPGRVCLESRSWWCHGQAQESLCSRSTQPSSQMK